MSLLEIKNVNISYHTNDKTVYAVQDVSLSVEEEESVGIVDFPEPDSPTIPTDSSSSTVSETSCTA